MFKKIFSKLTGITEKFSEDTIKKHGVKSAISKIGSGLKEFASTKTGAATIGAGVGYTIANKKRNKEMGY